MKRFVQRVKDRILGVVNGFDRIRLRGSLLGVSHVAGVQQWMNGKRILLKDFLGHCAGQTKRLKKQCEQIAAEGDRKVVYLSKCTDKEELVQSIRQKQGVADNGLVAVLSAVEMCRSFDIHRNSETHRLELQRRMRKALHYYFYFEDQRFGLTHVRLMSWFPFDIHVVINGREWLARDMDKAGIEYVRRDNCFTSLSDFSKANRLAAKHPKIDWPGEMTRLLRRFHPLHGEFFGGSCPSMLPTYYWTSEQTEWATDIVFRDPSDLADMYPTLIRRGMEVFQSPDVMRFLGHKIPGHGGVHGKFAGEVVSDMKRRPEGVRLKHRVGRNSVKMYDKFGVVLRVETTLNDTKGLKVYREKASDPTGSKAWQPLRKSVCDLSRRADLSQKSNARYLESIAAFDCDTPLKKLTDKLCQSVEVNGRRHRGLRPFDPVDVALLEAISRGEFAVSGFRNRDIRVLLEKPTDDPAECRRLSARTSRKLALLRAHGLIKKIPHTLRYELTTEARTTVSAILAARNVTPKQLAAA